MSANGSSVFGLTEWVGVLWTEPVGLVVADWLPTPKPAPGNNRKMKQGLTHTNINIKYQCKASLFRSVISWKVILISWQWATLPARTCARGCRSVPVPSSHWILLLNVDSGGGGGYWGTPACSAKRVNINYRLQMYFLLLLMRFKRAGTFYSQICFNNAFCTTAMNT